MDLPKCRWRTGSAEHSVIATECGRKAAAASGPDGRPPRASGEPLLPRQRWLSQVGEAEDRGARFGAFGQRRPVRRCVGRSGPSTTEQAASRQMRSGHFARQRHALGTGRAQSQMRSTVEQGRGKALPGEGRAEQPLQHEHISRDDRDPMPGSAAPACDQDCDPLRARSMATATMFAPREHAELAAPWRMTFPVPNATERNAPAGPWEQLSRPEPYALT